MDDHEPVVTIDLALDLGRQQLPVVDLNIRAVDVVKDPDLDIREILSLRNVPE
ncbi:hypothetical protein D3C87_1009330 [compost metagenome]